jgi:hypothetical protein
MHIHPIRHTEDRHTLRRNAVTAVLSAALLPLALAASSANAAGPPPPPNGVVAHSTSASNAPASSVVLLPTVKRPKSAGPRSRRAKRSHHSTVAARSADTVVCYDQGACFRALTTVHKVYQQPRWYAWQIYEIEFMADGAKQWFKYWWEWTGSQWIYHGRIRYYPSLACWQIGGDANCPG